MRIEEQIARLAELGLHLNEGITVDDILYSFPREEFEKDFELLLFSYGIQVEREPWGRWICPRVWNFDTECIVGSDSYINILKGLNRVVGYEILTDLEDFVSLETQTAWLQYRIDNRVQRWDLDVIDDWADTLGLSYVMDDIERDGYRFYKVNNGQAMILFYLDEPTLAGLSELTNVTFETVLFTD
jgi:hypothetical protein